MLGKIRRAIVDCANKPVLIEPGRGTLLAHSVLDVLRSKSSHHVLLSALDPAHVPGRESAEFALEALSAEAGTDKSKQEMLRPSCARPVIVPGGRGGKATAVVPFKGIVTYDIEFQPYVVSSMLFASVIGQLAADDSIGAIVIDMDSPGGYVTGTPEAGDAVFAAREAKKVTTLVNPLSASAAYWIASQSSEIVAVPSADIGSIGVFMAHMDCAKLWNDAGINVTLIYAGKFKVEGNPYQPLTEEAAAYFQGETDAIYADFLKAVARGRGVSVQAARDDFGQGRTMMVKAAKAAGMIDRVDTPDGAFRKLGLIGGAQRVARAAGDRPISIAEAEAAASDSQAEAANPNAAPEAAVNPQDIADPSTAEPQEVVEAAKSALHPFVELERGRLGLLERT